MVLLHTKSSRDDGVLPPSCAAPPRDVFASDEALPQHDDVLFPVTRPVALSGRNFVRLLDVLSPGDALLLLARTVFPAWV